MKRLIILVTLYFLMCSFTAIAQSNAAKGEHIEVALIAENEQLVIGEHNWIGILLSPEEHWHTYWQNPGDSGEPPYSDWSSSHNVEFGEFRWPVPKQIPVAHLVNYGYEGSNLLMLPISLPDGIKVGEQVTLRSALSWLVCKEDCIPGWADLELTLTVSDKSQPSQFANLFTETRKNLPQKQTLAAKYELTESHITLEYSPPYNANWQLLPLRSDVAQHNQVQTYLAEENLSSSVLVKSEYFVETSPELAFLLTDGETGFYLSASLNNSSHQQGNSHSIWLLMLMALVGGLILNVMPCVLPILSMKALALGNDNMTSWQKLGYGFGVLASFNLFAIVIILLKQSGEAIGWGFHMQEPIVIAFLAFLFVFIALILMDIAPSGSKFAGVGQSLVSGKGFTSQFMTGVLAVVVASPCTAPFMAAALGVALVSSELTTFLIFNALAVGFALPLSLLFISSRFASVLPKPGNWMNTFKHFLVFPMLATVVWLVWVYAGQAGTFAQFSLLMGLLGFAFLLWISSVTTSNYSNSGLILAVVLVVVTLSNSRGINESSSDSLADFSEAKLTELRNNNAVVLVNMTADWCITCKVNEQVAFSTEQVQAIFNQPDVHYMVGDWTNKNEQILKFLQKYERSGVPLYVVYAGNDYEQVLPQILTVDTVITAINQAQGKLNNE